MKPRIVNSKDVLAPYGGMGFSHIHLTKSRPHKHDYWEIILLKNGNGRYISEAVERMIGAGDLLVIAPGTVHWNEGGTSDLELYNIAFSQELTRSVEDFIGLDFSKSLRNSPLSNLKLSAWERERYLVFFEQGASLLVSTDEERKRILSRTLILNFCVNFLFEIQGRSKNTPRTLPDWLEKSCEEMRKEGNFQKGLPCLKKIACKSQEHLIRSFKRYLNQTPTEYVNSIRLENSAKLLATTETQTSTIAYESGFENLSHFYHLFKKKYGITPGAYREKMMLELFPQ